MAGKSAGKTPLWMTSELLYDALAEPTLWAEALNHTQQCFDADSSRIFLWDRRAEHMVDFQNSDTFAGHDARWDLQVKDPRRLILQDKPAGTVLACHEHFDDKYVSLSPFYTDFSLPYGRRFLMAVNMFERDGIVSILALFRDQPGGRFEGRDRQAFDQLVPELQRIGRLHSKLQGPQMQARLSNQVLDQLQTALIITDRSGRIIRLNLAAEAFLTTCRMFRVRSGRLVAATSVVESKLQSLITRAVVGPYGVTGELSGDMIVEESNGRRYAIQVSPLSARADMLAKPQEPLALVTLSDLDKKTRPFQKLVEIFGLTPAEATLAVALATGRRLNVLAEERKVQMTTLRTQIRAIYGKTGTNRLAELAHMIANLP